jgi:integrase|tara:strand:+ start:409 stop:1686 length:1278 start_codon:yes stop_codon:yes gene_type:complete
MPKFYEKRRQKYYAVLDVPKALREQLGVSRRFVKSLQTDSESIARIRVLPVIAKWKQEIVLAKASGNSGNQLLDSVVRVRQESQRLKGEGFDEHDIQWIHEDVAYSRSWDNERGEFVTDDIPLADAVSVVHGSSLLLAEHIEEHLDGKDCTAKSKDMAKTTLLAFCKEFLHAEDVTERRVRDWIIRTMEQERKLSYNTIKRDMSSIKVYWRWLKRYKSLDTAYPFEDILPPVPNKNSKSKSSIDIIGFSITDYHKILGAVPDKDRNLRNLIILGAHTGCRLDELCALKLEDVSFDRFQIVDAKTNAGLRTVPIHAAITQLVAELVDTSADGYLIDGESDNNQYNSRSGGIGHRFSRLKTKLGYKRNQVFHSWRHSMTTQLENAERPLSQIQRIIGHTVSGMTLSRYSDGLAFDTSKEIINLVSWK